MDFELSPALVDLRDRTTAFVRDIALRYESDPRRAKHGPTDDLRRELNTHARAAGLLSPHVGREWGGLGLNHFEQAVVFEAAGYSLLGPLALNCAAPDEGNMHLLELVASIPQKERWLRPAAAGTVRSCFCMTEPPPGAGADPSLLRTAAVKNGDTFVINGHKWFISGADGAAFAIVMARTVVDAVDIGATMFLTDMSAPGIKVRRVLDTIDGNFCGGHAEVSFDDLQVPVEQVLGEVGRGFQYAQARLVPARLTHCMRWLGAGQRAHDIALDYARRRESFGRRLGDHEGVGFMLADNLVDLQTSRLMIWHTAWLLDQGHRASTESSLAKVHCSEAIWRIADRAVQILGALGVSADTEVERIFRDVRPFRIYDGPSEVHRFALARKLMAESKP
jgi:acyl-CoA dehydrogenase